ncbi:hypothetical protein [Streptomyces sp. NPDC057718]|uniref:hypothetical protein n=1 Tax=Streptomyces sp. NPDC057718 TaxID=3346225 RepID=UPI0036AED8E4
MDYPVRALKTAAVAVPATLAAWWLLDSMYALIEDATEADRARSPFTGGLLHYYAAGVADLVLQPLVLWMGLRLIGVRGNHLAVAVSAFVWSSTTAGPLLKSVLSPGEAFWWLSVQCVAAVLPSLLQPKLFPESTQPDQRTSKRDAG